VSLSLMMSRPPWWTLAAVVDVDRRGGRWPPWWTLAAVVDVGRRGGRWQPWWTLAAVVDVDRRGGRWLPWWTLAGMHVVTMLSYANSMLNPLLYAAFNENLRVMPGRCRPLLSRRTVAVHFRPRFCCSAQSRLRTDLLHCVRFGIRLSVLCSDNRIPRSILLISSAALSRVPPCLSWSRRPSSTAARWTPYVSSLSTQRFASVFVPTAHAQATPLRCVQREPACRLRARLPLPGGCRRRRQHDGGREERRRCADDAEHCDRPRPVETAAAQPQAGCWSSARGGGGCSCQQSDGSDDGRRAGDGG